jgi:sigma-B regulation protein RsbU (phosphoserine phosphatase)
MTFIILNIFLFGIGPLKKITESIRRYTQSKDSERTISELEANLNGITGFAVRRNEIGQLSADVAEMTREIDDYIDRIETINAEKKRMEVELDLAARIQLSVLPDIFPPFPERKEFDLYASMDPAREVGGDFYDFFLIDDDHLGIVIADVSGKGVPAALFMMISKTIIKNFAMLGISASEIMDKSNKALCEQNTTGMFVTVWIGILEISTGKMTCSNAGHEYPAICHNGEFKLLKDKHGLVLGAMDLSVYKEYEIQLDKGDKIFVYTDGVSEATNAEDKQFGTDRTEAALNIKAEADPKEILKIVRASVDEFVGNAEQYDDLTMVCLEYKK